MYNNLLYMVNYYNERRRAIAEIDELLNRDTPIDAIIYKISMVYGFSAKIVRERVQQRDNLDVLIAKREGKK